MQNASVVKTGLIAFALALAIPSVKAQWYNLNEGDSIAVPFTNLDFLSPNTNVSSSVQARILFSTGLEAGESIQVEYFGDSSVQGVPFFTGSFTSPVTYADNIGWLRTSTEWDDLDGGVRVTMINGSAPMRGVQFLVERPGETYSRFQPVPEPRIVALLALGVAILLLRFRRHDSR
jgi:hypothetical protein